MSIYASGVGDALEAFGFRTASLRSRMPEGPMHLGAERLTRLLSDDAGGNSPADAVSKEPRAVRWGPATSLEAGSAHGQIGMSPFGGV